MLNIHLLCATKTAATKKLGYFVLLYFLLCTKSPTFSLQEHFSNKNIFFSPDVFSFSKQIIDYSIEFWQLMEQLTFVNSALKIPIFN